MLGPDNNSEVGLIKCNNVTKFCVQRRKKINFGFLFFFCEEVLQNFVPRQLMQKSEKSCSIYFFGFHFTSCGLSSR